MMQNVLSPGGAEPYIEPPYQSQNFSGLIGRVRASRFKQAMRYANAEPRTRAIDFGCADGYFLPTLAANYQEVVAYDIEKWYLEAAERSCAAKGLRNVACFSVMDDLLAHLDGKAADVVFMLEVIEHIAPVIRSTILAEIAQLLGTSGTLVLSMPVEIGPMALIKEAYRAMRPQKPAGRNWRTLAQAALFLKNIKQTDLQDHFGFDYRTVFRELDRYFTVEDHTFMPAKWAFPFASTVVMRARVRPPRAIALGMRPQQRG